MSVRQLFRAFHRWLGAALCLLFLTWFASGIVLTFAGFPGVRESEKLAHAAGLRVKSIRTQPASLASLTSDAQSIELYALGGRALYRVRSAAHSISLFADTGERLNLLDEQTAISAVSSWLHGATPDSARLTEVDQWTPQANRYDQLPFLRLRARDGEGTEIYVSLRDGDVLQRTTTAPDF